MSKRRLQTIGLQSGHAQTCQTASDICMNRPEAVLFRAPEENSTISQALPMTLNAKRICCWCAAALMLIVALYSAMGVLQAGSIYAGERALQNLWFWGAITVFSLIVSILFGLYAYCSHKTALP
jgi:hypothetical protein